MSQFTILTRKNTKQNDVTIQREGFKLEIASETVPYEVVTANGKEYNEKILSKINFKGYLEKFKRELSTNKEIRARRLIVFQIVLLYALACIAVINDNWASLFVFDRSSYQIMVELELLKDLLEYFEITEYGNYRGNDYGIDDRDEYAYVVAITNRTGVKRGAFSKIDHLYSVASKVSNRPQKPATLQILQDRLVQFFKALHGENYRLPDFLGNPLLDIVDKQESKQAGKQDDENRIELEKLVPYEAVKAAAKIATDKYNSMTNLLGRVVVIGRAFASTESALYSKLVTNPLNQKSQNEKPENYDAWKQNLEELSQKDNGFRADIVKQSHGVYVGHLIDVYEQNYQSVLASQAPRNMDNVKWIKNWIDEFLAANPDDKLQQRVTTIVARLSQQLDEIERQEAQGQEERKQQIARKQAEEKAAADAKAVEDARRQAEAEAVSNAQKRRQQAEAEAEAQAKAAADAQRRQAEAAAKLSVFDKSAGKPAVSQQSSAVPGEIAILNSRIANLTDKVTRLENDNKELQSKAEQLKQLQASNPALTDKITKLEQDIETERKARARDIVIHQTALAEAEEKARNLLQAYNNQLAAQAQVVQAPIQVIQPQSKPLSRKAIIAEYRSAQAAFQRDPNNTTKYARLQSAMRAFLDR